MLDCCLTSCAAHLWKFNGYDGLTEAIRKLQSDKVGCFKLQLCVTHCPSYSPPPCVHLVVRLLCICLSLQEWQAFLLSQGKKVYSRSSQIVMAFTYWPSIVKPRPPGWIYELRSYNLQVCHLSSVHSSLFVLSSLANFLGLCVCTVCVVVWLVVLESTVGCPAPTW